MNKKFNYYKLYVASPICDTQIGIEKYVIYETFGKIEHTITVNPRKILIYSKLDDNGNERFYDYKTNEEVFEESYESSFVSPSYGSDYPIYKKVYTVGYFIPLNEYIEEKFGFDVSSLTPSIVEKLIHLINIGSGRKFKLSMEKDIAKLQLDKIGYHKPSKDRVDIKKY